MTREEAVKMLQVTRLMLMDGANQPISDLYYALDMAIEALEQTEPTISILEQVDEPTEITYQNCSDALLKMWMDNVLTDAEYNRIMDKLNTKIAKAIVHKMIDDAVLAEDAYPDLRQKMHDAVDEYEPQTDDDAYFLKLMGAVERGEISDAGANQAWYEYINHKDEPQEVCDRPQKDCENCWKQLHCRAKDEPQTERNE